jgi:hypothetical protein
VVAAAGFGVIVFFSSIFGDLIESIMKREAGMKVRRRGGAGRGAGAAAEPRGPGRRGAGAAGLAACAARALASKRARAGACRAAGRALGEVRRRAGARRSASPHAQPPPASPDPHSPTPTRTRQPRPRPPPHLPRTLATSSPATAGCWTALTRTCSAA